MIKFNIVSLIALILGIHIVTAQQNIYDFQVTTIKNQVETLEQYKGKVLLIVNVASFCGYTKQYEQLQSMYNEFESRGLVILGFPSNEFGEQEPGTEQEIETFCKSKYNVTFPLFAKVEVNGENAHALYKFLTAGNSEVASGDVRWNFEKFLVNPQGELVKRYGSRAEPLTDVLPDVTRLLKVEQ